MYQQLGLDRNPFTFEHDSALYRETSLRRTLRKEGTGVLDARGNLWIQGPPGSGRQAFALNLAQHLCASGRPVLALDEPISATAHGFMDQLGQLLGDNADGHGVVESIRGVYARLLDGLWRGGPIFFLLDTDPPCAQVVEELSILAKLTVLGLPLVNLVMCGTGGGAPLEQMETLTLAPLDGGELVGILSHRLLMSGNAKALDKERLELIASRAAGPADALKLAALELGRSAFASNRVESAREPLPKSEGESLFSDQEVANVERLLKAISSK